MVQPHTQILGPWAHLSPSRDWHLKLHTLVADISGIFTASHRIMIIVKIFIVFVEHHHIWYCILFKNTLCLKKYPRHFRL